jgi:hypothetical protein
LREVGTISAPSACRLRRAQRSPRPPPPLTRGAPASGLVAAILPGLEEEHSELYPRILALLDTTRGVASPSHSAAAAASADADGGAKPDAERKELLSSVVSGAGDSLHADVMDAVWQALAAVPHVRLAALNYLAHSMEAPPAGGEEERAVAEWRARSLPARPELAVRSLLAALQVEAGQRGR